MAYYHRWAFSAAFSGQEEKRSDARNILRPSLFEMNASLLNDISL
jgi:hypothetical protein